MYARYLRGDVKQVYGYGRGFKVEVWVGNMNLRVMNIEKELREGEYLGLIFSCQEEQIYLVKEFEKERLVEQQKKQKNISVIIELKEKYVLRWCK